MEKYAFSKQMNIYSSPFYGNACLMDQPVNPNQKQGAVEHDQKHIGHIHLRPTMNRKHAYMHAARPGKLADWIYEQLDKAAGYKPTEADKSQ